MKSNSPSPLIQEDIYEFTSKQDSKERLVFSFTTHQHSTIQIIFDALPINTTGDLYTSKTKIYTVIIDTKSIKKRKIADPKVKSTICHIIYFFISINSDCLFQFTTDPSDKGDLTRFRLFSRYFTSYANFSHLSLMKLMISTFDGTIVKVSSNKDISHTFKKGKYILRDPNISYLYMGFLFDNEHYSESIISDLVKDFTGK